MRALVYVVLIAVAVAGPILYATIGADARLETAAATTRYLADRAAVDALLRADRPPRDGVLDAAEASLERRRTTVDGLRAAVVAAASGVDDAKVRELAAALGLDRPVIDSLLTGVTGPAATARRTVLWSVLGGLEPGSIVERLHCASLPEPIAGTGIARWRVEVALVAPLASVVRSSEALCSGDAARAPALLIAFDMARTRADEWARFATLFDQPPVRAQATLDVLVAAGGAP